MVSNRNADAENFDMSSVNTYFATLLKRPDAFVKNFEVFTDEARTIDAVNDFIQLPTKQHRTTKQHSAKMTQPAVIPTKLQVKRSNTTLIQSKPQIERQTEPPKMQNSN